MVSSIRGLKDTCTECGHWEESHGKYGCNACRSSQRKPRCKNFQSAGNPGTPLGRRTKTGELPWFEDPGIVNAFKNLGPNRGAQECMIRVSWSAVNDPDDGGAGHGVRRGEVIADLGLDAVPSPPFTAAEMQRITRAAKFEAFRCLKERKRKK